MTTAPALQAARHVVVDSPLGPLTLVAEGDALTRLHLDGARHRPDASAFGVATDPDEEPFAAAREQLAAYFAGRLRDFNLPLAPRGDAFQQRVWAALCDIPHGATTSYGELARGLGDANLAQAVGHANGRNPIAIVIPCHRVVGADGTLVGYAGGLDAKRFLLALEEPSAGDSGRLF